MPVLLSPRRYTPKFRVFEYHENAHWTALVPYVVHPDGTQIKAHMPYFLVRTAMHLNSIQIKAHMPYVLVHTEQHAVR